MSKAVLRWAGGKRWLLKFFDEYTPKRIHNYYEPFAGGISVLLHLIETDKISNISSAYDTNEELINFYNSVKTNPELVIRELKKYKNTESDYYSERARNRRTPHTRAAKFYFLNRTSFNGIYRENLKGEYNVPYGHKEYKVLFDSDALIDLSQSISRTEFHNNDFGCIEDRVDKGDLVFFDPPYTVAHENNGFVKYNQKIFSWEDQERLKVLIQELDRKGVKYILTNAKHKSIEKLYKNIGKSYNLSRASLVGGKGANRSKYNELIITNV